MRRFSASKALVVSTTRYLTYYLPDEHLFIVIEERPVMPHHDTASTGATVFNRNHESERPPVINWMVFLFISVLVDMSEETDTIRPV